MGVCVNLLAAILLWSQPTQADRIDGYATYYSPGLMRTVAENRHLDLSRFKGGVALNARGDLGRVVWLEFNGEIRGPFLSIDCAQEIHYDDREAAGYIVETSAKFADEMGFYGVGPVPVIVYFQFPFRERIPL